MNLCITGLAGCTKSTTQMKIAHNAITYRNIRPKEILFLSFNKYIKEEALMKYDTLPKKNIKTIHGFCFYLLRLLKLLPKAFLNIKNSDELEETKILKQRDYDQLISDTQKLDTYQIKSIYNSIKMILLDEYQIFREDYIMLIHKLMKIYNCTIVIAMDIFQNIYYWTNKNNLYKIKDNYSNLCDDLGIKHINEIIKNENKRSNPAILRVINGFLERIFGNSIGKYSYKIPDIQCKNKYALPVFRWFSHQHHELNYIIQQIKKYGKNKTIAIIGRYKRDLYIYEKYFSKKQNKIKDLKISTIHKFQGKEADIIFYTGFNININDHNDLDKYGIIYVGISRAKSKLYITSSYPKFNLSKIFDLKTIRIIDSQRILTKPNKQLKQLKTNRNFSIKKLFKSNIDSIVFCVPLEDVPYPVYIKKDKYNEKFSNKGIFKYKGMDITVKLNHRHKRYYFEFYDLNILKKNDYNNLAIINFCINYILPFFDYRITKNHILLYRLDLCRFFMFENNMNLFLDFLSAYFLRSHCYSIFDSNFRVNKINYLKYHILFSDWKTATLYINHYKSKYYGATTKCYLPSRKDNKNRIHIDNLVKIEISFQGNMFTQKRFFGKKLNAVDLLGIDEDGFQDIYNHWFISFHKYIEEIEGDFSELNKLKKLRGFEAFQEIFYK